MKATLILPWASALFLAAASAQRPIDIANKRDMCTEVCWLTDVGNVEGCKNRCMASDRPTPMEATEAQKCIDNCGTQYLTAPTVSLFDLCRRGCFATYFPAYIAPVHKLHKRKGPGLPVNIHELLKGRNYPVRREVCELSCKAQGHGSYLSPEGALNGCVKRCTIKPTAMEEETQAMYDCSGKKDSELNMCLEENIKKAAIASAAPSTGNPAVLEQEKKQQLPNYVVQTSMRALTATTAQPFVKAAVASPTVTPNTKVAHNIMPMTDWKEQMDEQERQKSSSSAAAASSSTESSAPSSTSDIGEESGAISNVYFGDIWFWLHAFGAVFVAMFVGIQAV